MDYRKNKSSGYTAIELLITIVLISIITLPIISFFISEMKICCNIDKGVELQQQGLFILSFIENKIMESVGVEYIEDNNGLRKEHAVDAVKINKIVFRNNEIHDYKGYIFNLTYKAESNTYNLLYRTGITGTGTVEVGNYIDSIEVIPAPEDKSYAEADGISIKINLRSEDKEVSIENTYFFRNKAGKQL